MEEGAGIPLVSGNDRGLTEPTTAPATAIRPKFSGSLSLFPVVPQPRPPTATANLTAATGARPSNDNGTVESPRRRSISLDETNRPASLPASKPKHGLYPPRAVRKGRKSSVNEVHPMSTLHELALLDSPTVPTRFTFRSGVTTLNSDDSGHGRSSSAPSEYEVSPLSATQEKLPAWATRQATASSKTLHGLGLTWPSPGTSVSTPPFSPSPLSAREPSPMRALDRPASRQGARQKPNLRINVRREERPDRPPPPPPKSPRHNANTSSSHSKRPSMDSRASSVQSRFSSRASSRPASPIAVAQPVLFSFVKPTFVQHSNQSKDSLVPREDSVRSTATAEPRTSNTMISADCERGRAIVSAVPPAPTRVPQLPELGNAESTSPGLSSLLSKFNIRSPRDEPKADGERTPRPHPEQPKPIANLEIASQSSASLDSIRKPTSHGAEIETASLSTNSLNSVKKSMSPIADTEVASSHSERRADSPQKAHLYVAKQEIPPPTPRKDAFIARKAVPVASTQPLREPPRRGAAKVAGSTRGPVQANVSDQAKTQSSPPPPSREPPRKPSSPKALPAQLRINVDHRKDNLPGDRSISPAPSSVSRLRTDRPTPELPYRSATPEPTTDSPEDPRETLRKLAVQTEALHARYSTLRSDRQKVSTNIVASLREQKAGPEYANTLLDQHLSLAAINSSMDICFAKLKSLDCRKEEAMTAILARHDEKRRRSKIRKLDSPRSLISEQSTPDLRGEQGQRRRSASRLRQEASRSDHKHDSKDSSDYGREKLTTGPRVVEQHARATNTTQHGQAPGGPRSTVLRMSDGSGGAFSSDVGPRNESREKDARAVKVLNVTRTTPQSQRSPDKSDIVGQMPPISTTPAVKAQAVKPLEIKTSTQNLRLSLPPRSPAPTSPLPSPPNSRAPTPPTPLKENMVSIHDTASTVGTTAQDGSDTFTRSEAPSRAGSSSATDDTEAATPQDEKPSSGDLHDVSPLSDHTLGKPSSEGVHMYIDDDFLDYYHE